ncbi:large conductance mechanosensitive channel protein MscL [Geomicrobium sp. JCM 19055]|uniref:large conductance mechanosensitive channel protein MscL n=1 Tax=Geomicrobium sp. JCM 19055 TaxID=1460649 RepID=UPI00045ED28D|nr:large conductance mechanosensitive channel protein MscL [Geomicrobium sp. JCM 19055]GAK00837.1 large-conductance mechanosensitive channel [Geomicrobium sp. JCM 19055]
MWKEFKAFIAQGNVLDLAVAVVIGAAFQQIVSSLVDHIIMPFVGVILGGVDFSSLVFQFGDAQVEYGMFIQAIVDFLIIALAIFIFVKVANKLIKRRAEAEEAEEEVEEEPPASEVYLKEIRDLLSKQQESQPNGDKE